MKTRFAFILACGLVSLALLFPANAEAANDRDKTTLMSINAPIRIPGAEVTLPAGKYVIKLVDTMGGTRNIVRIFNEEQDEVYATVLAIPNYRLEPRGYEFTFWETPAGEPLALRSWFYPGDAYGVEFAYPQRAASEIAGSANQNVLTVFSESQEPGELESARLGTTTPEGNETELAEDVYSKPGETTTTASLDN